MDANDAEFELWLESTCIEDIANCCKRIAQARKDGLAKDPLWVVAAANLRIAQTCIESYQLRPGQVG